MAAMALLAGCEKDDTKNDSNGGASAETSVTAIAHGDYLWKQGDRIGLFTSDDMNQCYTLSSGENSATAVFDGEMSPNSSLIGAYFPYSEEAGDDMTDIRFTIPATVEQAGAETATASFAIGAPDQEGQLVFSEKLAALHMTFTNIEGSAFENEPVKSITVRTIRGFVGEFSASVASPTSDVAVTNHSETELKMTFADGVTFTSSLEAVAAIAPTIKGNDPITVVLELGSTTLDTELNAVRGIGAGETLELEIDAEVFNPGIELEWSYGGLGVINKFSNHSPAIDGSGNVYFTTENSTSLYKLSPEGELLWAEDIGFTGAQNTSPSVEPDGSAIYAGGGGSGGGAYSAFNPDGSRKWTLTKDKFFSNGATPAPNFNQEAAAIGEKNIYIGNAGTTGSVLSVDKATGERIAYVSNATNGTGGPTGGTSSGMALSSEGVVAWFANYGLFAANKSLLDSPTQTHETYGAYVPFGVRYGYTWAWANSYSGVACTTIDGENCIASVGVEKTTGGSYNLHVIAAPAAAGLGTSAPGSSQSWKFDHKIENVKQQDQGGIVVGPQGELIVAIKNLNGDGGLYAVAKDGTKAWQFKCGVDVCGAAAVDNNGYVHFVDDKAVYYILKPDYATGECEIVASSDLYELAQKSGVDIGTATAARAWTSVMIGDDGRMYVACEFHNGWSERHGRLMCLSYYSCTAPGNTPWPMKWADCRHTCVQKNF